MDLGPKQIEVLELYSRGLPRNEVRARAQISWNRLTQIEDFLSDKFKCFSIYEAAQIWREQNDGAICAE